MSPYEARQRAALQDSQEAVRDANHLTSSISGHPFRHKRDLRHERSSLLGLLEPTDALVRCWQETELFTLNPVDWQIANGSSPPLSVR